MSKPFEFSILNWNIGGAKYLETDREKREDIRKGINNSLEALIKRYAYPDVITLQEVVSYSLDKDETGHKVEHIIDKDRIEALGYNYEFFHLIDTEQVSNQDKWDKVRWKYNGFGRKSRLSSYEERWKKDAYFAQGNSILVKTKWKRYRIWDLCKIGNYGYKFDWNKVEGNDDKKLIEFLLENIGSNWIKHLKIEKSDEGKTVNIGKITITLKFNEREDKLILEIQGAKQNYVPKVINFEHAFDWNKVPGDDDEKFKDFLLRNIVDEWDEWLKIEKIDNNIIKICSDQDTISLKLDKDKHSVEIEGVEQTEKFMAKDEYGSLNIYMYEKKESEKSEKIESEKKHQTIEKVNLDSGLYFGDRDTEPRAALIVHLIENPSEDGNHYDKPLDIFVINVHLTTIMMEREGIPQKDKIATKIRLSQLETIFDGIVSRYNLWKQSGFLNRGEERYYLHRDRISEDRYQPIWIVAGDFNFTPDSLEYEVIRRMNFIDVVPNKGSGTKSRGVGKEASLTLDYIFAGPNFISLDPFITVQGIGNNEVDHQTKNSDHYPIWAKIPIAIPESKESRNKDTEKTSGSSKADTDDVAKDQMAPDKQMNGSTT